jgi:hypothetical protein
MQQLPTVTSLSSTEQWSDRKSTENAKVGLETEVYSATSVGSDGVPGRDKRAKGKCLSRRDILRDLRCSPVDPVEEAACNGDHATLASLLNKRKSGFLRSKMQKAFHLKRANSAAVRCSTCIYIYYRRKFGQSTYYWCNNPPHSIQTRTCHHARRILRPDLLMYEPSMRYARAGSGVLQRCCGCTVMASFLSFSILVRILRARF